MDKLDFRPKTVDAGIYKAVVEQNKYKLPGDLSGADVCIDVGAHIGSFAIACLERGAPKVLAFESDFDNYLKLREHLAPYSDRAECYNLAVSRSDTEIFCLLSGKSKNVFNTAAYHVIGEKGTPVPAMPLDKILRDAEACSVLKISAEGSEYPILYTSKELHRVSHICGEVGTYDKNKMPAPLRVSGRSYKPDALMCFLGDEGFRISAQKAKAKGVFIGNQEKKGPKKPKRPKRLGVQPPPAKKVNKAQPAAKKDAPSRKRRKNTTINPPRRRAKNRKAPPNEVLVKDSMTFGWSSPYGGFWAEHFYRACAGGARDLYGRKIKDLKHAKELVAESGLPQLMMMGNFIKDREKIKQFFMDRDVDLIFGEDGFFPHYRTLHIDPMGFCWESSLPTLKFRECAPHQKRRAFNLRQTITQGKVRDVPAGVKEPYVLWPLQLIGDQVNRNSLNMKSWVPLLEHFRSVLPEEVQLVIKPHPRGRQSKLEAKAMRKHANAIVLPAKQDLHTLLSNCSGCAGANSTVLTEARLIYNKPVWAYAPSWYTNHVDLIYPITRKAKSLDHIEYLDDNSLLDVEELQDYRDWYTYQLLIRQYEQRAAVKDPEKYLKWVHRFTHKSFKQHGEDIFA